MEKLNEEYHKRKIRSSLNQNMSQPAHDDPETDVDVDIQHPGDGTEKDDDD